MSERKTQIFFTVLGSIVMGIILFGAGFYIFDIYLREPGGYFWGINLGVLGGALELSGTLCIILLPILNWYTIRKVSTPLPGEHIFAIGFGTIVLIITGIIFVIIGQSLGQIVHFLGLTGYFLGLITSIGFGWAYIGDLVIIISPFISWYEVHKELVTKH